jgi:8-oxo-dGTP pyrophosphatase MutT (NUDIX family)
VSRDEVVALYDPSGRPSGSAPRWRIRRENLPHAATCVVVRRSTGNVLVHRRSEAKDVYPGLRDCSFGGVVLAGEEPAAAAVRELAEEAGVAGAVLRPVGSAWYHDEHTWYLGFVYRTTWDGDVRFEDGEVAEAWWEGPHAVAAALADPAAPFVPDTRALLTTLGIDAVLG